MDQLLKILGASISLWLLVLLACGSDASVTPIPKVTIQPQALEQNGQSRTTLVSEGFEFNLQYVCLNKLFKQCQFMETNFAPEVLRRTNGQVTIQVAATAELGLDPRELMNLVEERTVEFGEMVGNFVIEDLPLLELTNLRGLAKDRQATQNAFVAAKDDLAEAVSRAAGGGTVLVRNWYANDFYFWGRKPLRALDDFKGENMWFSNTATGELIDGLGAEGSSIGFPGVGDALEKGLLDSALTCVACGIGTGWYKSVGYLTGPIQNSSPSWGVVNQETWDRFPPDIQMILLEVAEDYEVEAMAQSEIWEQEDADEARSLGLEFVELTPEVAEAVYRLGKDVILPGWVRRVGGPLSQGAQIWNDHFADQIGLAIEPDGTIVEVTIVSP